MCRNYKSGNRCIHGNNCLYRHADGEEKPCKRSKSESTQGAGAKHERNKEESVGCTKRDGIMNANDMHVSHTKTLGKPTTGASPQRVNWTAFCQGRDPIVVELQCSSTIPLNLRSEAQSLLLGFVAVSPVAVLHRNRSRLACRYGPSGSPTRALWWYLKAKHQSCHMLENANTISGQTATQTCPTIGAQNCWRDAQVKNERKTTLSHLRKTATLWSKWWFRTHHALKRVRVVSRLVIGSHNRLLNVLLEGTHARKNCNTPKHSWWASRAVG